MVKILEKSKDILWNGDDYKGTRFVCFAIEAAASAGRLNTNISTNKDLSFLKLWIENSIFPHLSVCEWLSKNHKITTKSHRKMQAYRLMWIDSMIKQLSV